MHLQSSTIWLFIEVLLTRQDVQSFDTCRSEISRIGGKIPLFCPFQWPQVPSQTIIRSGLILHIEIASSKIHVGDLKCD